MEPALISGFCSVKQTSLWLPLDGTLIHRRLALNRHWYSFTNPRRMESWVGLGGKEGCTNIRISAKPGIEPGTLWSEGRDLTNCTNHFRNNQIKNDFINLMTSDFTCSNFYGEQHLLLKSLHYSGLSINASYQQYSQLFEHFCQLEIGGDVQKRVVITKTL